jgi:two-component SAPR family response regulator
VLLSLGQTSLSVAGVPVRLKLRRALEVLSYLLRHPDGVSLRQVTRDLFPDTASRQAQLYFHQARYELEKKIPGLNAPMDASNRKYSVQCVNLRWDVLEFEQGLANDHNQHPKALELYQGPYMPEAEGEWVENERERLNTLLLEAGLRTCEHLYAQGQFLQCQQLAKHILRIEPLDEAISEHLIRATQALEGHAVAQQTAQRLRRHLQKELGLNLNEPRLV